MLLLFPVYSLLKHLYYKVLSKTKMNRKVILTLVQIDLIDGSGSLSKHLVTWLRLATHIHFPLLLVDWTVFLTDLLVLNPSNCSVQFSHSLVYDSLWPHGTAAHQASLSITNYWSLFKLLSIELVMPSNHLILCHPLLLLPSIFPSIRVFSNESVLHVRWPKYWSFSFSNSLSNEYSGLISFRMNWFDLLAVQGTLMSLFQYHSSKVSILLHSAFFKVQHSHTYMTTGKS